MLFQSHFNMFTCVCSRYWCTKCSDAVFPFLWENKSNWSTEGTERQNRATKETDPYNWKTISDLWLSVRFSFTFHRRKKLVVKSQPWKLSPSAKDLFSMKIVESKVKFEETFFLLTNSFSSQPYLDHNVIKYENNENNEKYRISFGNNYILKKKNNFLNFFFFSFWWKILRKSDLKFLCSLLEKPKKKIKNKLLREIANLTLLIMRSLNLVFIFFTYPSEKYLPPLVGLVSLPSAKKWTKHLGTFNFFVNSNIPNKWLMCECTPPSLT